MTKKFSNSLKIMKIKGQKETKSKKDENTHKESAKY